MSLLKQVESTIAKHRLIRDDEHLLVAVSGGVDSVALLDVLITLGYRCEVAHCNFHLRGEASDQDAAFVKMLTEDYDIRLHTIAFDTRAYAKANKVSIEMAARELRYEWFDTLCREHQFASIAVAHHADDNVETVLLNLTRGTGIQGLCGMRYRRERIVRPLLDATRNDIERYASERQLSWREDATNSDIEFRRNRVRHRIVPEIQLINAAFIPTMQGNIRRFDEALKLYRMAVDSLISTFVTTSDEGCAIDIEALKKSLSPETLLFEVVSKYGFSSDTTAQIAASLDAQAGIRFLSSTHEASISKGMLLIEPLSKNETMTFTIDEGTTAIDEPIKLSFTVFDRPIDFRWPEEPTSVCLDADLIVWPLTLRRWQQGDRFFPLGMNRAKKVSDFFVDNKLSRFEKAQTWLLESSGQILWIVGQRLDNRYCVTAATKRILQIDLNK